MPATRDCPSVCHMCKKRISTKFFPGLKCGGGCERWFHGACIDPPLMKEDIQKHEEGKLDWVCGECITRDGGVCDATRTMSAPSTVGILPVEFRREIDILRTRCGCLESENEALHGLIRALSARLSALESKSAGPFHSSPRSSMPGKSLIWPVGGRDLDASADKSLFGGALNVPGPATDELQNRPGTSGAARAHSNLRARTENGPARSGRDVGRSERHMVVVGRAKPANALPTVPRYRWLFVTRLARSVTVDQLCDRLEGSLSTRRRPRCVNLIPLEDTSRRVGSFRVELLPDEFKEALQPDFWDDGILVKEFLFRSRRGRTTRPREETAAPPGDDDAGEPGGREERPVSDGGGGESAHPH
ncbi:uncharacterized protein LOC129787998 [Lutzomyia longipalpis]|uniref:uncharacterized protein LOC129787998 n=1 Tax=Lutzomyia longipalpis TaxID=7200 RepID=UPI0024836F37|nr:uncharacterized protein LOC129787998 [Lutzomyia longipalpis]